MVQKKIKVILSEKSGVSILFVLAVMLLLMAIGVSTLTAASTAVGSVTTAWEQNQMEAYADSVIKTFTANLQSAVDDDFGRRFISEVHAKALTDSTSEEEAKIYKIYAKDAGGTVTFTNGISNTLFDGDKNKKEIKLTFPEGVNVSFSPGMDMKSPDGTEIKLPKIFTIKGFTMTATVEVELNKETIKKQIKYKYSGETRKYNDGDVIDRVDYEHGTWEVVRYGKIS